MSKVNCPCGTQISDVGYPCPNKAALFTDVAFDQAEISDSHRFVVSDVILDSRDVWECYECGRLAIDYPEAGSNSLKWYVPENGIKGDVMKPQEHK
jgi:surface antigen